eukprot:30835-Pelagococcus_subviridis.AAC.32
MGGREGQDRSIDRWAPERRLAPRVVPWNRRGRRAGSARTCSGEHTVSSRAVSSSICTMIARGPRPRPARRARALFSGGRE